MGEYDLRMGKVLDFSSVFSCTGVNLILWAQL